MVELDFPFEFIVYGTPVSFQAKRVETRENWKAIVREAAEARLPKPHFVSGERMAVTLMYFMALKADADIDNIIKLILDACCKLIYLDDLQVDRLFVQRFEPGQKFEFLIPSEILARAASGERPAVYVRISNNPMENQDGFERD